MAYEAVLQSITIDWDVNETASFDAVLRNVAGLSGFERIQVLRDDIQVFDGRYERSKARFGMQGRHIFPLSGFDWTRRLADFPTTSQSIVESSTANALANILSETDFEIDIDGTFEYISILEEWKTWIDFMVNLDYYHHTTVEIDLTSDTWVSEAVNSDNTYTMPNPGLKGAFMHMGGTQNRLYLWARDSANNIWYFHTIDGENWTAVDSGYNSSSNAFSVMYYEFDVSVRLFKYDGANTDFAIGVVDDNTGTISWDSDTANIFVGAIRFGPVIDDDAHIWVIAAGGNGVAYESTDDGDTWNNRFGPGANELWGLAQVGSDGDMYGICLDTVANDIEEWLWDRSAGTFAFTQKIADQSQISGLDVVQDASLNMYVTWAPGTRSIYLASNQSGGWLQVTVTSTLNLNTFDTTCDGYNCYVFYSNAAGFQAKKYHNATLIESWVNTSAQNNLIIQPTGITTTRCYLQDGHIAVYAGVRGSDGSVQSAIWGQRGVRITEGYTTGYFYTYLVSLAAMGNWGMLTGTGELFDDGESLLWDVYWGGFFQLLVDDAEAPFDLMEAGVTSDYADITVLCTLDNNGVDPYVKEFEVTGRTDSVSLDTDYEDAYVAVERLAQLAGAEFYVTFDGTTWTLHFTDRRGEDKSGWLVLKAASSSERPDVEPNIKVLDVETDWGGYANVVRCVGGSDEDGDRIVEHVRDNAEIATMNQEYWATIRNADVTTASMARQVAYLELIRRNTFKRRVTVEFLDKEVTNRISVGDSVMLLASWEHEGFEIKEAYRIISLSRRWGVNGETASAELSNNQRYAEWVNYHKKTDTHERWLTA